MELLGVLGGMGPMATADFFRKLIEETPAQHDDDHVPVVIYSVPQIPNRDTAITRGTESPLPQMLAGMRSLKTQGAKFVAIPCNTAHFWYDELQRDGGLPILHIADAACDELERRGAAKARVGLMATEATLQSRIYHDRLLRRGVECVVNPPEERAALIYPGIHAVKRGALEDARAAVERAVMRLFERGVETVILGCTELPVALEAVESATMRSCIDATRALARASVDRSRAGSNPS